MGHLVPSSLLALALPEKDLDTSFSQENVAFCECIGILNLNTYTNLPLHDSDAGSHLKHNKGKKKNKKHKHTKQKRKKWINKNKTNNNSFTEYEVESCTLMNLLLWTVSKRNHIHLGCNSAPDSQQLHSIPLVSASPDSPQTFTCWTSSKTTILSMALTFFFVFNLNIIVSNSNVSHLTYFSLEKVRKLIVGTINISCNRSSFPANIFTCDASPVAYSSETELMLLPKWLT